MAWTTADRDAVKAAYLAAVVDGVASCILGGHQVTGRTAAEYDAMLKAIEAELIVISDRPGLGLRLQQITPVYR